MRKGLAAMMAIAVMLAALGCSAGTEQTNPPSAANTTSYVSEAEDTKEPVKASAPAVSEQEREEYRKLVRAMIKINDSVESVTEFFDSEAYPSVVVYGFTDDAYIKCVELVQRINDHADLMQTIEWPDEWFTRFGSLIEAFNSSNLARLNVLQRFVYYAKDQDMESIILLKSGYAMKQVGIEDKAFAEVLNEYNEKYQTPEFVLILRD